MPPPATAEEIMAILGSIAGRQEALTTQLETVSTAVKTSNDTVDRLAERVQANMTAIDNLGQQQSTFITNFGGQLARLETSLTATNTAVAKLADNSPTSSASPSSSQIKLATTRLGPGHQDWLRSAFSRIASTNANAARLLVEPELSFEMINSQRRW